VRPGTASTAKLLGTKFDGAFAIYDRFESQELYGQITSAAHLLPSELWASVFYQRVGRCYFAIIIKFHDDNTTFLFVFSREDLRRAESTERIGLNVFNPNTLEFHLIRRHGQT
jgi:hypothetical protein